MSTFYTYTDSAIALNTYLNTFFTAVKNYLPNTVTIGFPSVADRIDPITGNLIQTDAVTGAANVVGTVAGSYSAVSGLAVRWTTAGTVAAVPPKHGVRRVTGHTYLVPTAQAAEGAGGIPGSAATSAVNGAAAALLSSVAGNLLIWSRPVFASNGTIARNGKVSPVLSGVCLAKMVPLRSRRD